MKKNIFVVIDMQNDFVSGSLGSEAAKFLPEKINYFTIKYVIPNFSHLICTMDTHFEDYLTKTLEGKMLPVEHCIDGSKGADLAEPFGITIDNFYDRIHKKDYNGKLHLSILKKTTFGSISLPFEISKYITKDDDIKIYICGLCTDICVITNALILRTHFPNHHIYIIEDLCAGVTEKKHKAAIEVMESCQCEIITSDQFNIES